PCVRTPPHPGCTFGVSMAVSSPRSLARGRARIAALGVAVLAALTPVINPATPSALAAGPAGSGAPAPVGYWLVASDGGIFAFGAARLFGSPAALTPHQPSTGMAPTPTGNGYWLTASDGGVFTFGDAGYFGAAPSRPANSDRTVVSMVPTAGGGGYWQAG